MAFSPTEVSNARLQVGTYMVEIGPHQWDFTDGAQFYGRTSTGSNGAEFTEAYDIVSRVREVRFIRSAALTEALRELAYRAGLTGMPVKFTPNASSLTTFWWIDWPEDLTVQMVADDRFEIRVRLLEQSPGLGA